MAEHLTVQFHGWDDTTIDVQTRKREDGSGYIVIALGGERELAIFATPDFVLKLQEAIANKVWKREEGVVWRQERQPTEAEAMFIGMVEKELEEEGSCP